MKRICQQCGGTFQADRNKIEKGEGKYCSLSCTHLALSDKMRKAPRDSTTSGGVVTIPLTKGKVTTIDIVDIDLTEFLWFARRIPKSNSSYVCRKDHQKQLHMHRIILERILGRQLAQNEMVDHINNNQLDNRRANLRLATASENVRNQSKKETHNGKPTSSNYKGVTWIKRLQKWRASVLVNGKRISLGCYANETLAANAYDQGAKRYFGEFAKTNFEEGDKSQKTPPTY